MLKVIVMPKIGVNMVDAVIEKWLVQEGSRVQEGQMILSAETDKSTQDIPVTGSGIVARLLVKEGDTVVCQQPLMVLSDESSFSQEDVDNLICISAEPNVAATQQIIPEKGAVQTYTEADPDRIRISPLATKEAKRLGIDPRLITPAQLGARIGVEDVQRYANQMTAAQGSAKEASVGTPVSGMRRIIAQRMLESVSTKPTVALTVEADAEGLLNWRACSKRSGNELRYNEMLIKICAMVLRDFPQMNSTMEGDCIHMQPSIHIGLAVDTEQGLVVPKVFDADKKDIYEIQKELEQRIENVRTRQVKLDEVSDGTFTITNLGMYGIEHFDAIINPPECSILAIGAIVEKPVVRNGMIVIGHTMQMTLSFDHRIVDGAIAAKFLKRVRELTESPITL